MNHTKCPICAYEEKQLDEELPCCPRCGADFTQSAMEQKLMTAAGTYTTQDKQFFGKMSTNASLYLTDRRLLAIPEKLEGFNLSTRLTAAVVNKMTSQNGVISIPLDQIKAVREGKFGLLGKALIVDTADGGLLKLTMPKQKQWKEALLHAAPNL